MKICYKIAVFAIAFSALFFGKYFFGKYYISYLVQSQESPIFNKVENILFYLFVYIFTFQYIFITFIESYMITEAVFIKTNQVAAVVNLQSIQLIELPAHAASQEEIENELKKQKKVKQNRSCEQKIKKGVGNVNNANYLMNKVCYCLGNMIMIICTVIYQKPNPIHYFFFVFIGLAVINNIIQMIIRKRRSITSFKIAMWILSGLMILIFYLRKVQTEQV